MPCGSGGCGSSGARGCGTGGGCGSRGGCSTGGCGSGGTGSGSVPSVEFVGARFPHTARSYHFDSNGYHLEAGEPCVVETDQGPAYALVTQATTASSLYTLRRARLKKVVRRASLEDQKKLAQAGESEQEAFEFCLRRISDRGLEMKLVNVQLSMDGGKATFFFTGEGRVDFRALVRDVSSKLRLRVEMRQIGVRDGAKLLGGYGDCGRPLCCSTFLKRFEPITIQMAKAQNLALNPARISGMCGRLKCCLKYEYVPTKRPKKAPAGRGPQEGKKSRPSPRQPAAR
jgi:cell fate regulator YaaT (PSP1 superfamily)